MRTKPLVIAVFTFYIFSGTTGSNSQSIQSFHTVEPIITLKLVQKNNGVAINWSCAGPTDHTAFEIERSKDGVVFSRIASMPSSFRDTANYSYFDNDLPLASTIYYRLRQCKVGNNCVYSETKPIKIIDQKFLKIYPLSSGGVFRVMYTATDASDVLLQVYKNNGSEIYREKRKLIQGLNEFDISIDGLPTGLYVLKVTEGEKFTSRSFVK